MGNHELAEEIERLAELRRSEALTNDEFEHLKQKVLAQDKGGGRRKLLFAVMIALVAGASGVIGALVIGAALRDDATMPSPTAPAAFTTDPPRELQPHRTEPPPTEPARARSEVHDQISDGVVLSLLAATRPLAASFADSFGPLWQTQNHTDDDMARCVVPRFYDQLGHDFERLVAEEVDDLIDRYGLSYAATRVESLPLQVRNRLVADHGLPRNPVTEDEWRLAQYFVLTCGGMSQADARQAVGL